MLTRMKFGSDSMSDLNINPENRVVSRNEIANRLDHAVTTPDNGNVYNSKESKKMMGVVKKNTPSNILLYRQGNGGFNNS